MPACTATRPRRDSQDRGRFVHGPAALLMRFFTGGIGKGLARRPDPLVSGGVDPANQHLGTQMDSHRRVAEGSTTAFGREGEARIAQALASDGWTVLDRNWRDGPRELDLVVRRGEVLAFVEVKRRGRRPLAHPLHSVNARKRRDVERAAASWLAANPGRCRGVETFRFDVATLQEDATGGESLEYLPHAWSRGE